MPRGIAGPLVGIKQTLVIITFLREGNGFLKMVFRIPILPIDKKEMTLLQYLGKKAEPYEVLWGIKRIGDGAFEFTKLNSIVIPNSVTSIGEYAFRYMNNLTMPAIVFVLEDWTAPTEGGGEG